MPNLPLNSDTGTLTLATFNGAPAWSTSSTLGLPGVLEYYTITDLSTVDPLTMIGYHDSANPGFWTQVCPLGSVLLPNGLCGQGV